MIYKKYRTVVCCILIHETEQGKEGRSVLEKKLNSKMMIRIIVLLATVSTCLAEPPSSYLPPSSYSTMSQHSFAPPSSPSFGLSAPSFSLSSEYGTPSKTYLPSPKPIYSAPAPIYKAPAPVYSAPAPIYSAPKPSRTYLPAPTVTYSAPKPVYGAPSHEEYYNSEPAKYEYQYTVNDPHYGTDFGHKESRDGDVTHGQYMVLLPDGRRQIVDYVADKHGYRPTIRYEGTAHAYEAPIKQGPY